MDAFKFSIDQRVRVTGTDIEGFVDALMLCRRSDTEALVTYFDRDNVQRTEWMIEDRLEEIE